MPVVFRLEGFRFHFYSDECNPREPVHIHVSSAGASAKFWLFPQVELAYNYGYDARTIWRLQGIVAGRRGEIVEAWNGYFG